MTDSVDSANSAAGATATAGANGAAASASAAESAGANGAARGARRGWARAARGGQMGRARAGRGARRLKAVAAILAACAAMWLCSPAGRPAAPAGARLAGASPSASAAASAAASTAASTTAAYQQTHDPDRAYRIEIDGTDITFSGALEQIAAIASRRSDVGAIASIRLTIRNAGAARAAAPLERAYEAKVAGGAATFSVGGLPDGQYYLTYGAIGGEAGTYYGTIAQNAAVEGGRLSLAMSSAYAANKAAAGSYAAPSEGEHLDYQAYSGAISAKAAEITAPARDSYHAAKLINMWVANNIYYDIEEKLEPAPHSQSPAAVFRDRAAVCYGYANITQALLNAAGIQARSTVGMTASGEHSWTEAHIGGRWVLMDSTWESANRFFASSGMYSRGTAVTEESLRYFDMTLEYMSESYIYGRPPEYSEPAPARTAALAELPALWPGGEPPAPNSSVAAAQLGADATRLREAGAEAAMAALQRGADSSAAAMTAADSAAPAGAAGKLATPTASRVLVNGKPTPFGAYNIDGSNYFKLRDLAFALSGTQKRFDVSWDAASDTISVTRGKSYTPAGGEMSAAGAAPKTPAPTAAGVLIDGVAAPLAAYNIDGANYFKLRDVGRALDFGVEWRSSDGAILVDTGKGYTPD
jgi:hypothetical protein